MDDRMSIGTFSRASGISARTLRNYHDSGLLVPAVVDAATGYRSYTVDQLADAVVIVRLRALDVPLPQVHEVLRRREAAFTAEVLARHQATMEQRLAETQRIVETLQAGASAIATPAHVQRVEACRVVTITDDVQGPDMWAWLVHAFAVLHDLAGPHATAGAAPGALYGPGLDEDDHEVITAFVEVDDAFLLPPNAHRAAFADLPDCDVAVLAHDGGFDTIGETYLLLGAWVARHRVPHEAAPVRERYRGLAPGGGSDATIEIQWPLATDTLATDTLATDALATDALRHGDAPAADAGVVTDAAVRRSPPPDR